SGFSPRTVFYISGSPPPPNPQLNGITAISANDVWAVGYYQNYTNGFNGTLTEHWDGSSWKLVPSPNASSENQLIGVTAISANDVWAVGYYQNYTTGYHVTLIEHWDGSSWKVIPSPNASSENQLSGVTAVSANDVWAIGSYRNSTGFQGTLVEHWDGTT